MNRATAERLARYLMDDHGLTHWTFGWDRAVRRFGCCHVHARRITLSRVLTEANPEDHVRDTILHEIAHAIVWDEHGSAASAHGPEWRATAARIGADPTRTTDGVTPTPPLVGMCPSCPWTTRRHRRRRSSCPRCSGGRYNETFRIVWVDTRQEVAA